MNNIEIDQAIVNTLPVNVQQQQVTVEPVIAPIIAPPIGNNERLEHAGGDDLMEVDSFDGRQTPESQRTRFGSTPSPGNARFGSPPSPGNASFGSPPSPGNARMDYSQSPPTPQAIFQAGNTPPSSNASMETVTHRLPPHSPDANWNDVNYGVRMLGQDGVYYGTRRNNVPVAPRLRNADDVLDDGSERASVVHSDEESSEYESALDTSSEDLYQKLVDNLESDVDEPLDSEDDPYVPPLHAGIVLDGAQIRERREHLNQVLDDDYIGEREDPNVFPIGSDYDFNDDSDNSYGSHTEIPDRPPRNSAPWSAFTQAVQKKKHKEAKLVCRYHARLCNNELKHVHRETQAKHLKAPGGVYVQGKTCGCAECFNVVHLRCNRAYIAMLIAHGDHNGMGYSEIGTSGLCFECALQQMKSNVEAQQRRIEERRLEDERREAVRQEKLRLAEEKRQQKAAKRPKAAAVRRGRGTRGIRIGRGAASDRDVHDEDNQEQPSASQPNLRRSGRTRRGRGAASDRGGHDEDTREEHPSVSQPNLRRSTRARRGQ